MNVVPDDNILSFFFFLFIIFLHILSVATRLKVEYIQLCGIVWLMWYRVIKQQYIICGLP